MHRTHLRPGHRARRYARVCDQPAAPGIIQKTTAVGRPRRGCLGSAGSVWPTLPVAFDSETVERRTASGLARFNGAENLRELERSLTACWRTARRSTGSKRGRRPRGRRRVRRRVARQGAAVEARRDHRVVVVFADDPTTVAAERPLAPPTGTKCSPARAAFGPTYLKGPPEDRARSLRRRGEHGRTTTSLFGGMRGRETVNAATLGRGRASPRGPFPFSNRSLSDRSASPFS